MSAHETVRKLEHKGGSDRSFGFVFAIVFVIVALGPLIRGGEMRTWALAPAAGFLLLALTIPAALRPLNRVWTKLGELLGRVVSPLVAGILFFLVVTPIGLLMRMLGKDLLRLRREPSATSYWIERKPDEDPTPRMVHQF